jgi:hypothetical protein
MHLTNAHEEIIYILMRIVSLQESRFIEKLVEDETQMEGLADNCSRVMVWNFDLEPPQLNYPAGWRLKKNLDVVVPIT